MPHLLPNRTRRTVRVDDETLGPGYYEIAVRLKGADNKSMYLHVGMPPVTKG